MLAEFLTSLGTPFPAEPLFDNQPDMVFFLKNQSLQYLVVNQTLVRRLRLSSKAEALGRRADELFPAPLGQSYREQDEAILASGQALQKQLELHLYPGGQTGWCLTDKIPLQDRQGAIVGLIGISRDISAADPNQEDLASLRDLVDFIRASLHLPLTTSELSKRAGLSPYQLSQRMQRVFQVSLSQFLFQERINAAIHKLKKTNRPIVQVAFDCGYADQSAFTRAFRQAVGITPAQFRQLSSA